ncbi:Kinesin-like protein at 54D [Carabus blaptoides fortunei]
MMVMRPNSPFKTPPVSRGTSPVRTRATPGKPSPVRNAAGNNKPRPSPSRSITRKPGSSPNVAQRTGFSPDRNRKRISPPPTRSQSERNLRTRGSSPGSRELIRSRGSESGSIERLDETGHFQRIITSHQTAEDNINVVVRVRPLNSRERKTSTNLVVQYPGNGQILCDGVPGGPSGGQKPKLFSFNVVFEPAATQEDVLEYSGVKRLLEMAVEGFSCTAFCYGQTGSGKTHTLTGPPGLIDKRTGRSEDHGLVIRSFNYLFRLLQDQPGTNYVLKASFLEIYNEKVIDLLNPGSARKPLAVRWSKKARGFFVENLFTVDCEELDDLIAVLEEGMRNRSVGSHSMNDYSSRSHTILTVNIQSEQPAENGVFISKQGKINFVDLAGSEMTKKTHSEGKTLEEANNINKSLMVLGYCISSLSDNKKKSGHIPYRDSKLTKLLADSLAGNGVTLMIACISPARNNLSETINTLRYAARAKKIRTKPIVVMDPREALILSLKREVGSLKIENEQLRSVLHLDRESPSPTKSGDISLEKRIIPTPPQVNLEQLAKLEGPQLAELVRLYMQENEELKKENADLYTTREMVMRDQELVCRENERLLKKLEDVNSVCCRSPIIPARPTFSAEMLNKSMNSDLEFGSTNIWTNPLNSAKQSHGRVLVDEGQHIPEAIQKELDKRRIGSSSTDAYRPGSHRRHNSWDGRPERSSDCEGHSKGSDSADSASSYTRRARMHTTSHTTVEGANANSATERRNASPNRRFSYAHNVQQPAAANYVSNTATPVLPDRSEFSGRSRIIAERSGDSAASSSLSLTESLLSGPFSELSPADNSLHQNFHSALPAISSSTRHVPNGKLTQQIDASLGRSKTKAKPDVFGSMVSLDDDDDLVFSNVTSTARDPF